MANSSVKAINILSYILNVVLIVALVYVLRGGFTGIDERSQEEIHKTIKTSIEQQERAQLPMTIQNLNDVSNVVIDSLVLTNNVEPYQGYLVTHWDYNAYGKRGKNKQVLVEVSNISVSENKITWQSNWLGAKLSLL